MSHFIGLVFGNNVHSLLEPYDEGLRAEPYIELTEGQRRCRMDPRTSK